MKADIFFINGQVINVYSGEILPYNAAVSGKKKCYVGPSKALMGPGTRVKDEKIIF